MNLILNTILNFFAAHKLLVTIILCVLGLAVFFGILTHERNQAIKEKQAAEIEANRQRDKADGLGILINSNTQAAEIQREKELANKLAENSNLAINRANEIRNTNFNNTSLDKANLARCAAYPESGGCK